MMVSEKCFCVLNIDLYCRCFVLHSIDTDLVLNDAVFQSILYADTNFKWMQFTFSPISLRAGFASCLMS